MKKLLVLVSILLISSCTNYNSIEEKIEDSSYTLFCYKEYKDYEEYIEFSYKDNIVYYINYSYNFNKKINQYKELDKYKYNINYSNNSIDLIFENININSYKEIKENVIKLYNLEKDNYEYIENNVIKYNLFRNYLEDYSCE